MQLVLLIAMIALMTVFKMHHTKKTPPEEILNQAIKSQKKGGDAMDEYQEKVITHILFNLIFIVFQIYINFFVSFNAAVLMVLEITQVLYFRKAALIQI